MKYAILLIFAIAVLYGFGTDQWNNVMSIGGAADVSNFVVAIGTLGLIGGFFWAYIWRLNRLAGVIVGFGVALSMFFSMGASIDRISSAKADKIHAAASTNDRIRRADQRVSDLTAKRDEEAARGGCKSECRKWEKKLAAAIAERNRYGVTKVTDQGSMNIEYLTAGVISAKRFRMTHPAMGVFALTFLVYGISLAAGSMVFGNYSRAVASQPTIIEAQATEIQSPVIKELAYANADSMTELADRCKWPLPKTSREVKELRRAGKVNVTKNGKKRIISLVV